jgi:hypothetical protein
MDSSPRTQAFASSHHTTHPNRDQHNSNPDRHFKILIRNVFHHVHKSETLKIRCSKWYLVKRRPNNPNPNPHTYASHQCGGGKYICLPSTPGLNGASYAPGIATSSYTCSPGAAAKCSCRASIGASCMSGDLRSSSGGVGGDGILALVGAADAGAKPTCETLGVAPCIRIGGAWRWKGLGSDFRSGST